MNVEKSELVGCRSDLARLANRKGLKRAVEIGTDRGLFAAEFLSKWDGEILYCVDTWAQYQEMPWDRTGDFMLACAVLAPEARRVRIVRASSMEAASYFANELSGWPRDMDFVYIDGAHDEEHVTQDIYRWWPIVRQGGILAGDDFGGTENPAVTTAVVKFATQNDLTVRLTTDYDRASSWYIEK